MNADPAQEGRIQIDRGHRQQPNAPGGHFRIKDINPFVGEWRTTDEDKPQRQCAKENRRRSGNAPR